MRYFPSGKTLDNLFLLLEQNNNKDLLVKLLNALVKNPMISIT
jgi:hypothetical protein